MLYEPYFIWRHTPIVDKNGEYRCAKCGVPQSQHAVADVQKRKGHVFHIKNSISRTDVAAGFSQFIAQVV